MSPHGIAGQPTNVHQIRGTCVQCIGQTPKHARFYRAPPNAVWEKHYRFLHPSLFRRHRRGPTWPKLSV